VWSWGHVEGLIPQQRAGLLSDRLRLCGAEACRHLDVKVLPLRRRNQGARWAGGSGSIRAGCVFVPRCMVRFCFRLRHHG
jgi:hypothetical protein